TIDTPTSISVDAYLDTDDDVVGQKVLAALDELAALFGIRRADRRANVPGIDLASRAGDFEGGPVFWRRSRPPSARRACLGTCQSRREDGKRRFEDGQCSRAAYRISCGCAPSLPASGVTSTHQIPRPLRSCHRRSESLCRGGSRSGALS